MKKIFACLFAALAVLPAAALDLGNGLNVGGGVKTGILVRNSDYTGKLEGVAHGDEYPMTLYFGSHENESYKGEGWLNFGYTAGENWGLNLSFWAHGDIKEFRDTVHLGDYNLWANLFDKKLRFIGGNGGGTPITSGGWLNADWLGYTGLRVFWVDPLGFSLGINFPNPDDGDKAEGIKPVNYFSTIMFGGKFEKDNFWASLMFNNTPIYDDTEGNFDGGLHRPIDQKPIAQAGNIAFGIGVNNFLQGKGLVAFDGMVTNMGEDDVDSTGSRYYKISPLETTLALKAGYPATEKIYAELKGKYHIKNGSNEDDTGSTAWGRFEIEPYASYQFLEFVKFETSLNYAYYVNSYYLASAATAGGRYLAAGWAPSFSTHYDYYSPYQFRLEPAFVLTWKGIQAVLGYKGEYSRDAAKNTMFLDLKWSF